MLSCVMLTCPIMRLTTPGLHPTQKSNYAVFLFPRIWTWDLRVFSEILFLRNIRRKRFIRKQLKLDTTITTTRQ